MTNKIFSYQSMFVKMCKIVDIHSSGCRIRSSKIFFSEEDNALRQAVAEVWKSKKFSDVEVYCGVDGEIVLTHKIVLVKIN